MLKTVFWENSFSRKKVLGKTVLVENSFLGKQFRGKYFCNKKTVMGDCGKQFFVENSFVGKQFFWKTVFVGKQFCRKHLSGRKGHF